MKERLIILILLTLATTCFAQTFKLSGFISDKRERSLSDSFVLVDSKTQVEASSRGYYEVSIEAGKHLVQAFAIGMKSQAVEIDLSSNLTLDFSLEEFSLDLDGIEIVTRRETSGLERLKSIDGVAIYESKKNEVIVLDDFAANKATSNARQLFAKVPGLNIWESDYAGIQLDIAARGLGPSRTANFNTRQNGYDMSADALGYPESYYIPAMLAVERIEIVRGAASLQYGPQFGGMLNFKLKEAPEKALEINLDQSIGSFGLSNSFISAGGKKNKFDYYSYYQLRTGQGWRENSPFTSQKAFARVAYQASERLKIGLEYSYMDYEAQQPGGITDEQFLAGNLEDSNRARNWFAVNWNLTALTADWLISDQSKFNLRAFGLFSQRDALGNLQQIGVLDNPGANRTLITDQFQNYGAEARFLHNFKILAQEAALVIGYRYYRGYTDRRQGFANSSSNADFELINPEDPDEFDYEFPSENHAVFAENLIRLTPDWTFTAGFRLEHIRTDAMGVWKINRYDFAGNLISSTPNFDESSTSRWVPLYGIGSSYYLKNNLHIYSNFSRNFRSITFSDLRVVNPNFQLDSLITDENGYNLDFGLRGNVFGWVDFDLSVFLLRYNDRIGQYDLPGTTTLFKTNIGDSRHVGIEFFSEFNIFNMLNRPNENSRLTLFTNLALTEATYIRSEISAIQGRRVEYVPNVMLRMGINYGYKRFKLSYQLSYLGNQFADATNSRFNPNALTGLIPSYFVSDFSLEYGWKRLKLSGGVNNLSDEKYFTRRAESYPGPGIIPATPRSFYLSLGLRI